MSDARVGFSGWMRRALLAWFHRRQLPANRAQLQSLAFDALPLIQLGPLMVPGGQRRVSISRLQCRAHIDYSTTKADRPGAVRMNHLSRRSCVRDQRQICTATYRTRRLNVLRDSSTRPGPATRRAVSAPAVAKARVIRKSNLRNRIFGRDRRARYEYN